MNKRLLTLDGQSVGYFVTGAGSMFTDKSKESNQDLFFFLNMPVLDKVLKKLKADISAAEIHKEIASRFADSLFEPGR